MAGSRKSPSADGVEAGFTVPARTGRITVGLSGGVDSVVLLHLLHGRGLPLRALHVHHGLSPNARKWQAFCAALCKRLGVPFSAARVRVKKGTEGLEAAARAARHAAFRKAKPATLALAHHLDDQAETVLLNLLRGTGLRGASGMAADSRRDGLRIIRPLLQVPRSAILAYAKAHRLEWIEDESNADEDLTRNFIRRRVGPLVATRFPRWRENLARAARHFAKGALDERKLLRAYLADQGLKAPSEAKLLEMLKQLGSKGAAVPHDGRVLRRYRDRVVLDTGQTRAFQPRSWNGEARLTLPGGELRFRPARGTGIAREKLKRDGWQVRARSGGERFRPEAGRPRRTLKNLFQEAGVPPWERERLPMLFCGEDLVWAPVLGVDVAYRAGPRGAGVVPEWRAA